MIASVMLAGLRVRDADVLELARLRVRDADVLELARLLRDAGFEVFREKNRAQPRRRARYTIALLAVTTTHL